MRKTCLALALGFLLAVASGAQTSTTEPNLADLATSLTCLQKVMEAQKANPNPTAIQAIDIQAEALLCVKPLVAQIGDAEMVAVFETAEKLPTVERAWAEKPTLENKKKFVDVLKELDRRIETAAEAAKKKPDGAILQALLPQLRGRLKEALKLLEDKK